MCADQQFVLFEQQEKFLMGIDYKTQAQALINVSLYRTAEFVSTLAGSNYAGIQMFSEVEVPIKYRNTGIWSQAVIYGGLASVYGEDGINFYIQALENEVGRVSRDCNLPMATRLVDSTGFTSISTIAGLAHKLVLQNVNATIALFYSIVTTNLLASFANNLNWNGYCGIDNRLMEGIDTSNLSKTGIISEEDREIILTRVMLIFSHALKDS